MYHCYKECRRFDTQLGVVCLIECDFSLNQTPQSRIRLEEALEGSLEEILDSSGIADRERRALYYSGDLYDRIAYFSESDKPKRGIVT